jgi:hypothetical protein
MRLLFGIFLIVGGVCLAPTGAALLWHQFYGRQEVTQTGPNEFVILESEITEITMFGKPVSFTAACVISLVPGVALVAIGLYVCLAKQPPA